MPVPALEGNGGGRQLKPNQMLQPEWGGGDAAGDAAKLDSQIVTPILLARKGAGGRMHSAFNILEKAVFDVANYQPLFLLITGFMIAGANAQNPDGSSELKTLAVFWDILAKTNVKVVVGTILVIGGIGIAGTCMHSRQPAFTEADITEGLARGPTVARRSDPTFEIHPSIC